MPTRVAAPKSIEATLTREEGQCGPHKPVEQEGGEDDDGQAAPLVAHGRLVRLVKHQLLSDGAAGDGVGELRPALSTARQGRVRVSRSERHLAAVAMMNDAKRYAVMVELQ